MRISEVRKCSGLLTPVNSWIDQLHHCVVGTCYYYYYFFFFNYYYCFYYFITVLFFCFPLPLFSSWYF